MSSVVSLKKPEKAIVTKKLVDWRDELGAVRAHGLPTAMDDVAKVGGATLAHYALTARISVADAKKIHEGVWTAFMEIMGLYGPA